MCIPGLGLNSSCSKEQRTGRMLNKQTGPFLDASGESPLRRRQRAAGLHVRLAWPARQKAEKQSESVLDVDRIETKTSFTFLAKF